MRRLRTGFAAVGVLILGAPLPAAADWLVLRDGSRVETVGAWKADGKRVTFTLKKGGFSSLRASEVDLEASAAATRTARESALAPAPAPPPKKSVLVLTDADVAHVDDEMLILPPAAVPGGDAEAKPGVSAPRPEVAVASWDRAFDTTDSAMMVTGTIRNTGKNLASGVSLTVRVFDEEGKLSGEADASLTNTVLQPGATAEFRAMLPGVLDFLAAKFDVQYTSVLMEEKKVADPQS